MHNLNLAISHGCKQRDIENTMDTIKEMTSFFSVSAKRMELLKRVIKEEAPDGQKTKLVTLCTTLFLERHEAVTCLCELLPMVLKTFEYICDWEARDATEGGPAAHLSLQAAVYRELVRPGIRHGSRTSCRSFAADARHRFVASRNDYQGSDGPSEVLAC